MVAAAAADGSIDEQERRAILQRLSKAGLSEDERRFVTSLLDSPPSMEELLSPGVDSEFATQVYAVSLMAIEVDTESERAYLRKLSTRLGLNRQVVSDLHQQLGVRVA
jgi:uncharacterized membrane protein YebE (DUF533 family)